MNPARKLSRGEHGTGRSFTDLWSSLLVESLRRPGLSQMPVKSHHRFFLASQRQLTSVVHIVSTDQSRIHQLRGSVNTVRPRTCSSGRIELHYLQLRSSSYNEDLLPFRTGEGADNGKGDGRWSLKGEIEEVHGDYVFSGETGSDRMVKTKKGSSKREPTAS